MKKELDITEQQINAFVDDELDAQERAIVVAEADKCKTTDTRLSEYRKLKDLIRHSYESVPATQHFSSVPHIDKVKNSPKYTYSLSAVLVLFGFLLGGFITQTNWLMPVNENSPKTSVVTNTTQDTLPTHYLLHLASNKPNSMDAILTRAEILVASRSENNPLKIEVIANSAGIDLMRIDMSPFSDRIAALASNNVKFLACARTIKRLRSENIDVHLVPQAIEQYTAMQRVVDGLNNGAVYEQI